MLIFAVTVMSAREVNFEFIGLEAQRLFERRRFISNVETLAADSMLGRGTGQEGGYKAAGYLENEFRKIGLKPAGDNGTFRQEIPFHEELPLESSKFILHSADSAKKMELFKDYLIHKSGGKKSIPKPVEIVFAGYGIDAPEYGYNDYDKINAAGKIVFVLTGEPFSDNLDYFNGEFPTVHGMNETKQRTSLAKGALACVIIPTPDYFFQKQWDDYANDYKFPDLNLAYYATNNLTIILKPSAARRFFNGSRHSLHEVFEMAGKGKIESFSLTTKASFTGKYRDRNFKAPNIIGLIEGSDPLLSDTYVLLTAHYDHLGIGAEVFGDSIYNGLNDNAVGTSGILELARAFKKHRPARSVIFMLVTAEEKGLLGSYYYVNNPKFPLGKTIANINVDGLGFVGRFRSVIGVGARYAGLWEELKEIVNELGMTLEDLPQSFEANEIFNRSDQIAFAKAGIPSILIMDGTDYADINRQRGILLLSNYMAQIYHSPFDDKYQHLNYDAMMQHLYLIYRFAGKLAGVEKKRE